MTQGRFAGRGQNADRNGRGSANGQGNGQGQGTGYTSKANLEKVGLCIELHSPERCGDANAADLMWTNQEKIVQHVGLKYGEDISNEVTNKTTVVVATPVYYAANKTRHQDWERHVRSKQTRVKAALDAKLVQLRGAAVHDVVEIANVENEIEDIIYQQGKDVPYNLTKEEDLEFSNESKSHSYHVATLEKHRGNVYALIYGQCTQILQDKIKQDKGWPVVSDPRGCANTQGGVYGSPMRGVSILCFLLTVALILFSQVLTTPVCGTPDVALRVNVLYEITPDVYLEYFMIEEEAQDLVENLGGYRPSLQAGCWMHLLTGGFHYDKNCEMRGNMSSLNSLAMEMEFLALKTTTTSSMEVMFTKYQVAASDEELCNVTQARQGNLSNNEWYERHNTKCEVAKLVGVSINIEKIWESCVQDTHKQPYSSLTPDQQALARSKAKECVILYALINSSNIQHKTIREDLSVDYTKGMDNYPRDLLQVWQSISIRSSIVGKMENSGLLRNAGNARNNCSVGGPMENFNNPGVIVKYAVVDPWVDQESGFLLDNDPVVKNNFDCIVQVLRMENQKIDDKINNSSVMVLMENDEPLRDTGQASIHAYITSTVMVTTEESDNSVDLVDVAEADWDNQSTLLLNVDYNITGVYPHDHNDEVVAQCDNEVVSDTVGGDAIEQTIKQKPVNMPVVATTSKLMTVKVINGIMTGKVVYGIITSEVVYGNGIMTGEVMYAGEVMYGIMTGKVVYYKYCSIPFGCNCQISTEGTPSNSKLARMEGVRAPGTSGNTQGGHTLGNASVVMRRQRINLPMTEAFIAQINFITNQEAHPISDDAMEHFDYENFATKTVTTSSCLAKESEVALAMEMKVMFTNLEVVTQGIINDCGLAIKRMHDITSKMRGMDKLALYKYKNQTSDGHQVDELPGVMLPEFELIPIGNVQGGHKFYTLSIGKVVTQWAWTALPTPPSVIERIHVLAQGMPAMPIFTDPRGHVIGDVVNYEIYNNDDNDDDTNQPPFEDAELPGVHTDETGGDFEIPGVDPVQQELQQAPTTPAEMENEVDLDFAPSIEDNVDPPIVQSNDADVAPAVNADNGVRKSTRLRTQTKSVYFPTSMMGKIIIIILIIIMRKKYTTATTVLGGKMFGNEMYEYNQVVAYSSMKLSIQRGMKQWGDEARVAGEKEISQLQWRERHLGKQMSDLITEENNKILPSYMFVVRKRDGVTKARLVAGGNQQRGNVTKEESSSPTVSTESVFWSSIVDTQEVRGVAVIEIPSLKKRGFEVNPFSPCVWNKTIKEKQLGKQLEKQLTVCFDVDNCKISHVTVRVVDYTIDDDHKISHVTVRVVKHTIEWLRDEYESIFTDGTSKMKVVCGKVHTYVGMTNDFMESKIVKVIMFDHIDEIVQAWDKACRELDDKYMVVSERKRIPTAAPEDLFKVDEDAMKLDQAKAKAFHKVDENAMKLDQAQVKAFHNITAKMGDVNKREGPDISLAVAFLTAGVKETNIDNWRKLCHVIVIDYLQVTVLGADGIGVLSWYCDASFAVHPDMRGHTGGTMTMGRGFPLDLSTKHKLNLRNSTESEIIAVNNLIPQILWMRLFMKAQGNKVRDNILYQDNKSAVLLETNGRASSSKRTKHINIWYYYVADRVAKGDLKDCLVSYGQDDR